MRAREERRKEDEKRWAETAEVTKNWAGPHPGNYVSPMGHIFPEAEFTLSKERAEEMRRDPVCNDELAGVLGGEVDRRKGWSGWLELWYPSLKRDAENITYEGSGERHEKEE